MLHLNLCAVILIVLHANFASGDNKKLRELMEEKAREQGIDPNNLRPGETFMIPPELSDEEEGSHHMPEAHRCVGCTAVAFQVSCNKYCRAQQSVEFSLDLEFKEWTQIYILLLKTTFNSW